MSESVGRMLYEVSLVELKRHFTGRYDHHVARSAHYAKEADGLDKELDDAMSSATTVSDRLSLKTSNSYNNTESRRDQLRAKVRSHAERARFFDFAGKHVPNDPTFSHFLFLESELRSMEFL